MKKILYILVLIALFLVPVYTFAEVKPDKEFSADEKEVKVYFFRGEGCSHCAEAEEWFESIEKKYGDKFEVISYEVWNNDDNNQLMQDIAAYKETEVEGVPYILVGKNAWNGFDQSYTDNIIHEIEDLYEDEPSKRYDIMDYVSGKSTDDGIGSSIAALLITIVVIAGIGSGVYFSRKVVK